MSMGIFSTPFVGIPKTREILNPDDTATGITAAIRRPTTGAFANRDAKAALIQCKTQGRCKFTIEGTDPTQTTAGIGFVIGLDESFMIVGKDAVNQFRCIDEESGIDSKLEVVCFF